MVWDRLVDGKFLYLFDRGSAGIIRWNTDTDTGGAIAYPYKTPLPGFGRYVAAENAVWCGVWDFAEGQYVPLGLARLDVAKSTFTGWFPFPSENTGGEPFTDPSTTLFYPYTLRGKLVPFDTRQCKWRQPIEAPGFGTRFGFIGLASIHDGSWYFSISTYNGTPTGCDGQPYHFCNALMEFDPRTSEFAFPTLDVKDRYYQVSYHLSAGGQLFATGNNIRQADGSLDQSKPGDIIVWQTQAVVNPAPGE